MKLFIRWLGIVLGLIVILAVVMAVGKPTDEPATQTQSAAGVPTEWTEPPQEGVPVSAPPPRATNTPRPTQTPRPQPTPKPTQTPVPSYGIGDTYTMGNADRSVAWEFTVTKVDRVNPLVWSQYGNKTDAKGVWQLVYLTVRNIGRQTQDLSTRHFEVHDSADYRYSADYHSNPYSEHLGLSKPWDKFPPGVAADVTLAFDVNPEAQGLRLYLTQSRDYINLE